MPQPEQINVKVVVDVDVARARRQVKRVIAEAGEANRFLAQLEDTLERLREELSTYGITLEEREATR